MKRILVVIGSFGLLIALKFSKILRPMVLIQIVRIKELQNGYDKNGEHDKKSLKNYASAFYLIQQLYPR